MSKETITEWSGRAYTWSLITYASKDEIKRLLDFSRHWCLCYHDKDTKEDGTPKEPHTHILVTFEREISLNKIQSIINSDQNTLGECRRKVGSTFVPLDVRALYEYQLHIGYPDKYHYDSTCRICDNKSYWNQYEKTVDNSTSKNEEFFTDLFGEYRSNTEFELFMARKWGRDYIKNRTQYAEFRFIHMFDEFVTNDYDRFSGLIQFCIINDIEPTTAIEWLKARYKYERGISASTNI